MAQTPHGVSDGAGALNSARRTVEVSEEAVTGGVDLVSAKAGELVTHEAVMLAEQHAPRTVSELGRLRRRVDDVGEQHRRQDPIEAGSVTNTGKKFLDLVEHRILVA